MTMKFILKITGAFFFARQLVRVFRSERGPVWKRAKKSWAIVCLAKEQVDMKYWLLKMQPKWEAERIDRLKHPEKYRGK
ncbi:MAG: hypothetical protein JWQ04_2972 [Pedosphaera sp.]|nr:hypothetical protein [Pedosphaera sp.]